MSFFNMRWLEPLLCIILLAMVFIVFSNVVGRYIFSYGLTWAEELSRFLFVWLTFLGAVLALTRKAHIGMDAIVSILPRQYAKIMKGIAIALTIVFFVVLAWQSISLIERSMSFKTPALGIPRGYIYTIVPISSVLMAIVSIHDLFVLRESNGVGDA